MRSATKPRIVAAAVAGGLALSGAVVWQGTAGAFTASVSNSGNSWTAGTVALSDSQGGSSAGPVVGTALFTASGLVPDMTPVAKCITVTYNGSVNAGVKLYAAASGTTTAIDGGLTLKVEEATPATGTPVAADCTGWSSATGTTTTVAGMISSTFKSTYAAYSSGTTRWAATPAATRVYRITYSLPSQGNTIDNTWQGTTASVTFAWEAQTA